jgi:hypothetical protein
LAALAALSPSRANSRGRVLLGRLGLGRWHTTPILSFVVVIAGLLRVVAAFDACRLASVSVQGVGRSAAGLTMRYPLVEQDAEDHLRMPFSLWGCAQGFVTFLPPAALYARNPSNKK